MAIRSVAEELGKRRLIAVGKQHYRTAEQLRAEFDRPELVSIVAYPAGKILVHVEEAPALERAIQATDALIAQLPPHDKQLILRNAERMAPESYIRLADDLAEEILCED